MERTKQTKEQRMAKQRARERAFRAVINKPVKLTERDFLHRKVWTMKNSGLNSPEVAERLHLPLVKVNKFFGTAPRNPELRTYFKHART